MGASVAYTIVSGLLPEGGGRGVAGKVDPAAQEGRGLVVMAKSLHGRAAETWSCSV